MQKRVSGGIVFAATMVLFGTIGIFREGIPLPSSVVAMARGVIGSLFLILVGLCGRKRGGANKKEGVDNRERHADCVSAKRGRDPKTLCGLFISGVLIGANWILLFEAYRYTTVATATLCYYMAPVIVMLLSPPVCGERLGLRQLLCIIAAVGGMIPVSGILSTENFGGDDIKGVLFGLGAAVLYASVILINKRLTALPAKERTTVQLLSGAVVLVPYVALTEDLSTCAAALTWQSGLLLLTVGILHTGVAYAAYFASMEHLPARTVALFSYIDPVTAVILSAWLLSEPLSPAGVLGAVLILGAALIGELPGRGPKQGSAT